jgi:hypothetical protein
LRTDANRIALRAAQQILAAAKPLELAIEETRVLCSVERLEAPAWPYRSVANGLDAAQDGPWPAPIRVDCRWDGGQASLRLAAEGDDGSYHRLGLMNLGVRLRPGNRRLVHSNIPLCIGDKEDGTTVSIPGWCAIVKRRKYAIEALHQGLKDYVARAGLPLLSAARVLLFQLELPSGAVLPSPEVAFRHLVQLALLKLDFLDRGHRAAERGMPLIDVRRLLPEGVEDPIATDNDDDLDEDEEDAAPPSATADQLPLNLILYGPPGTGKTYHLLTQLIPQFTRPTTLKASLSETEVTEIVGELPWWQVVALALHDLDGSARVEDLVAHPWLKAKYAAQGIPTKLSPMVWGQLQQHTVESSDIVKYSRRSGLLLFDRGEDGKWFLANPLPAELVEIRKDLQRRSARSERGDYEFVTLHQSYSYEDFIEGIRPRLAVGDDGTQDIAYRVEDGVFLRAVRAALRLAKFEGTLDEFCRLSKEERSHALNGSLRCAIFIDEINRGNVARVFGELITLLEDDKRLGADKEVIVTLPYSRSLFGVPSNLHVVGTMNTADRSVEALDSALRRRFSFQELPPRPEILDFTIEGQIDPALMLRAINLRLEKLRDRDHCIGHAFLQHLKSDPTLVGLKRVFGSAILPLLQEYFFGDWAKIGLVLGREFVRKRETSTVEFADFPHDDREMLNERAIYELVPLDQLTNKSFQRIYQHVPDD